MDERWLPIAGYEGLYEVSDAGRVRALPRLLQSRYGRMRRHGGRVLLLDDSTDYLSINLRDTAGGKPPYRIAVHVLVAQAFIGEKPTPDHEVCHWDGDKANNKAGNLRWGTRVDNMEDQRRHGTLACGHKNGNAVVSEELAGWIRDSGQSGLGIARLLGISHSTVCRIKRGASYRVEQMPA